MFNRISYIFMALALVMVLGLGSCGAKVDNNASGQAGLRDAGPAKMQRLAPDSYQAGQVLDAAALLAAYTVWEGKKVRLAGYTNTFFDSETIKTEFSLRADAAADRKAKTSKQVLVTLLAEYGKEVSNTALLVVEGIISGSWDGAIQVKDAVIVDLGETVPSTVKADPMAGTDSIFSLDSLFADYFGWEGKLVRISGNYWGVTTSSNSYGTSHRVDLTDALGNKVAGCHFDNPPPEPSSKEGVVIEGSIKGLVFDTINLEKSVFISPVL